MGITWYRCTAFGSRKDKIAAGFFKYDMLSRETRQIMEGTRYVFQMEFCSWQRAPMLTDLVRFRGIPIEAKDAAEYVRAQAVATQLERD